MSDDLPSRDTAHSTATLDATGPIAPTPVASPAPTPRRRRGTSPNRIVGLDIARGLAVIGMFAAHILTLPELRWTDPGTWGALAEGRSSILFAMLAGVSIGIMTAGRTRRSVPLLQARMKIAVRATLIMLFGAVLEAFDTPVAVILGVYGLLFLTMLPFITWSFRQLLALTLGSAVVGAAVAFFLIPWLGFHASGVSDAIVGGAYPAIIWFTFVAAGLTLSRLDLRALRTQATLLVTGIALVAAGHLGFLLFDDSASNDAAPGTATAPGLPGDEQMLTPADIPSDNVCQAHGQLALCMPPNYNLASGSDEAPPKTFSEMAATLVSEKPHSGTPFEVFGSGGFAVAMIGGCLLLARLRVGRILTWPVAAVGSMALTAYAVHIAVIRLAGIDLTVVTGSEAPTWAWFAVGALVACSLWKAFLGRGPLERFLGWVAARTTAVAAPGSADGA